MVARIIQKLRQYTALKILLALVLSFFLSSPALQAKEVEKQKDFKPASPCSYEDPTCFDLNEQLGGSDGFEEVRLERIIDGDTFVASGRKIRLWGIDAPEKDHPAHLAATLLLQALTKEGKLTCKLVDIDRYQREVMHCRIDGLDIAGMIVKMGMAIDFKRYSGGYYKMEEKLAKDAKRGIWKASTPPPP